MKRRCSRVRVRSHSVRHWETLVHEKLKDEGGHTLSLWRVAPLCTAILLLLWSSARAQLNVAEPDIVWRIADAERAMNVVGEYRNAFSFDGTRIGIVHQNLHVQVR